MPRRTVNAAQLEAAKGQWIRVVAVNPASICCEESLMVCALRTVGVALHPLVPFEILTEEVAGRPRTLWRWGLGPRSADGQYATQELIAWWKDKAWLAAHRTHEFAIVAAALKNMGVQSREARARVPRAVVRHGRDKAHIPVNATPARRAWLLARLEGRLPLNTPFVEPAAA